MCHHESIGPEELAELERLALVGEMTGALVHDCNNFLNVVLLQVALLEMSGSGTLQSPLADLRGEGNEFKATLGQLQSYRRAKPAPPYPVDINSVARGVVDTVYSQSPDLVRLELSPGPLEVTATISEMKRLVVLLLADHVRKAGGRPVVVRTDAAADKVRLCFEQSVESEPAAESAAARANRKPLSSLEWGTCRAMAQRLRWQIREETMPDGAASTAIEFPLAAAQSA